MKCISNENNPATLRILIAANLANVKISLEIVKPEEWKVSSIRRLPILLLPDNTKIFSANVAVRYLLKTNYCLSGDVVEWLSWDSLVLQPTLHKFSRGKAVESELTILLTRIENRLANTRFLTGNQFGTIDVVVWSSLYAVINDSNKNLLSGNNVICSWFKNVAQMDFIKAVTSMWKMDSHKSALRSFCDGFWLPNISDNAKSSTLCPDSENVHGDVNAEEIEKAKTAWTNSLDGQFKSHVPEKPILPRSDTKNVFITSALPYVNNVPHLGNIIGCVLSADVFSRYCRLRNWNTLYVCGTDEYGTATETKALEEKLTPQQICDKYFKIHKETYEWFNICFDCFGRTTTPQQKEITQELFKNIHESYTHVESVEQLLCTSCDRFLADRFVEGVCPKCSFDDARGDQCDGCGQLMNAVELINPRCKLCSNRPIVKNSDQLFLDLPKIEPTLQKWIAKSSDGWTQNAKSITNTWLKDGLKPRCITRDLSWGTSVPVKGFEHKVFYVWFDAPIGYMSITACYTKEWRKWWQPPKETPVTYYQFMAKDNVPFHSVMFPATLLAADKNYILVNHIMATEYLNYEDGKFSKSRGYGVFGTDAKDTGIPADVFRFYLLYVRPEGQDTSFCWNDLATKHNTELLNNVGNFVNRALMFTEKFFGNTIPNINLTDELLTLMVSINRELSKYNQVLEKGRLRDGIKHLLSISRLGNQFIQHTKPWVLVKGSDSEKIRAGSIVGLSVNIVALLAIVMQPYMPSISKAIKNQLNAPLEAFLITNEIIKFLPEGHKIGKPSPLFAKIEQGTVEMLQSKFSGKQKTNGTAANIEVSEKTKEK